MTRVTCVPVDEEVEEMVFRVNIAGGRGEQRDEDI